MKYIHSQESLTIPEGGEFISLDFFLVSETTMKVGEVRKKWRRERKK